MFLIVEGAMPIYVSWGDETESYIHYQLFDPWNWDDYYEASLQWRELVNAANRPVVTLLDFSKSTRLPDGALTHLKKAAMSAHPHFGGMVIVGFNTFIRVFVTMMTRVFPSGASRVRMAADLKEALTYVQAQSEAQTEQPIKVR
jgi:hypothetical protein